MAIQFNDNIKVNAGKPIDSKYLSSLNAPYTGETHVTNSIPVPERHIGLTVNINNSEYWFASGVTNSDLVLKTASSGSTINGVQNVGSGIGIYSGVTAGGSVNLRSILGSGDTAVSLSGDTVIIRSTGGTSLENGILRFDSGQQTFQPYTGFTSGVTFYENGIDPTGTTRLNLNARLSVTELRLSTGHTASGSTHLPGDIYWDEEDSTVSIKQSENVIQQVGQELFVKVKNNTAGLITNGSVVYISGSDGGRPTVQAARASQNDTSIVDEVIGLATENIAAGNEGFVTISGLVRDIVTTGFTEGDIVYLSTTVYGGLTNVKPEYPDYTIEVGVVTNVGVSDGRILVRVVNISQPQVLRSVEIINPPFTASTRSDVISSIGSGIIYLPASPLTGQQITVIDHDGDAGTFTITINGNGKLINGDTQGMINTNYGSVTLVYNGINWYVTVSTP